MQGERLKNIEAQTVYSAMKSTGQPNQAQGSIGHEVDAPTYPLHHDTRPTVTSILTNVVDTKKHHKTADDEGKIQTKQTADLTISHTPGTFKIQTAPEGRQLPKQKGYTP